MLRKYPRVVENFARLTVSITKALKQRMDRFEGKVNWSAVARQAFEQELMTMEKAQEIKLDPKVVSRLRQSKNENEASDRNRGYRAGKDWAEDEAEYVDLHRLAEAATAARDIDRVLGDNDAASNFIHIVAGDEDGARDYYEEFWLQVAGTPSPSNAFVYAFAEAALEVFEEFERVDG